MVNVSEIFDRIEIYLSQKNMCWADLARELGIAQRTFSDWFRRGRIGSFTTFVDIAEFLDVPIDILVYGKLDNKSFPKNILFLAENLTKLPLEKQEEVIFLANQHINFLQKKS